MRPRRPLLAAIVTAVVISTAGCALDGSDEASPVGFGPAGDKADGDGDAIYAARRIYRGCQGDGCMGLELQRLHHPSTACEDGSFQRVCYAADEQLDWSATGLDPIGVRTLLTALPVGPSEGLTLPPMPVLLRVEREADGDDLVVTEVWQEQVPGHAPRTELVGVVEGDDGTLHEQVLNRPGVRPVAGLDLDGLDQRERDRLEAALPAGVILGADDEAGPDGATVRRVYQFWTRRTGR